jgi:peptidoglycan/xylan/chitin deacetylase (PgdA/CDA1 family)
VSDVPDQEERQEDQSAAALTRRRLLGLSVAAVGAVVAACGGRPSTRAVSSPSATTSARTSPTATATAAPPPDPATVRANEIGVIPVLMHHRLVTKVDSEFDMTPAWFQVELERLRRERYYPVTMLQVARGDLGHVPAGRSPVVLTFDDSSAGQLHYTKSGQIAPDSAVGMLLAFGAAHPDFPAVASFYLNKDPFALGDPHRALADLVAHGFEVGNHTFDHVPLRVAPAKVQQQLGELAAMVTAAVPGVTPRTLALPLGVEPSHPSVVRAGSWHGTSYRNEAVLLVGANPSHSPFHRQWTPDAVPRIRSSSYQAGKGEFLSPWWLDQIKHGAVTRYVSAGNPGHVTVPKAYADRVAPAYHDRLITY